MRHNWDKISFLEDNRRGSKATLTDVANEDTLDGLHKYICMSFEKSSRILLFNGRSNDKMWLFDEENILSNYIWLIRIQMQHQDVLSLSLKIVASLEK